MNTVRHLDRPIAYDAVRRGPPGSLVLVAPERAPLRAGCCARTEPAVPYDDCPRTVGATEPSSVVPGHTAPDIGHGGAGRRPGTARS